MQKGVLSVVALVLIHIVNHSLIKISGSGFMWGSLSIYLISYLKITDKSLKLVDGFFCMGIVIFCINASATFGVMFEKRFGYKKLVFLGVFMIMLGYIFVLVSTNIVLDYFALAFIGLFSGLIVFDI